MKSKIIKKILKAGLCSPRDPCESCREIYGYLKTYHEGLREQLAELEHVQWAHWAKYMLANLNEKNIARWQKQIKTNYKDLSKREKDSDRIWADRILDLLERR